VDRGEGAALESEKRGGEMGWEERRGGGEDEPGSVLADEDVVALSGSIHVALRRDYESGVS
jgi:hypothetical protein